MRLRHITMAASAVCAAIAVAGCGEVKNTIYPQPGTTTQVSVMLAGAPNGLMAGVYEAIALGYYHQADMQVELTEPTAGENPLIALHDYKTQVAVSSEPNVLLQRNDGMTVAGVHQNTPVVAVGAIVQRPLSSIPVTEVVKTRRQVCPGTGSNAANGSGNGSNRAAKGGSGTGQGGNGSGKQGRCAHPQTKTVTTTKTTHLKDIWEPGTPGSGVPTAAADALGSSTVPEYQGLVFAVRPNSIINDTSAIRRFLQMTARGYAAARRDPEQAIDNMITLVPSLSGQRAQLLAQLKAFLPQMFPGVQTMGSSKGTQPAWGFQNTAAWTQFGYWLHDRNLITNANAVTDASTNELLAGQGV